MGELFKKKVPPHPLKNFPKVVFECLIEFVCLCTPRLFGVLIFLPSINGLVLPRAAGPTSLPLHNITMPSGFALGNFACTSNEIGSGH